MEKELWRVIRALPIDHTFKATPQGEIYSAQKLVVPHTIVPNGWSHSRHTVAELGPFYFRRLASLSRGLIRVREDPDEVRFELGVIGLPLLRFGVPAITWEKEGGTSCYPITGGFMLQPGSPTNGYLCMSIYQEGSALCLDMVIREYYSRIQGSGATRWLRRQLYAYSQAAAHHFIARDYLRHLALAIGSGQLTANHL